MGAIKLTFDGSLNTAKQDAEFNYFLTNKQNGIIKGLKNEIKPSISNGKITFKDGYVSIYGRRIYIENGTSINVIQDSIKYGYVILKIDTSSNEVELKLKEGTNATYPSLIEDNLIDSDGIYEFPLVSYYKTTSSVSIFENSRKFVKLRSDDLKTLKNEIEDKIDNLIHGIRCKKYAYPKETDTLFRFSCDSEIVSSNGILYFNGFRFNGSVPIVQLRNMTQFTYYFYDGSLKKIFIERSGNDILFTMPDTSYSIKEIWFIY